MKRYLKALLLVLVTGCAGTVRDCSSCSAGSFGADWLVVQYTASGTVMQCWKLPSTSIDNEGQSDGIFWLGSGGHLVHISGWYNRVQVSNGDWDGAASALRIKLSECR